MEETKKIYQQIKIKLCSINSEKEIYELFGTLLHRFFPAIIACLQRMKLSILEKIHLKKIQLEPSMNFIAKHLENGLWNETVILQLLEDHQQRKTRELIELYFCEVS